MTQSTVQPYSHKLPAISNDAVLKVDRVEKWAEAREQVPIETTHILHGGMYARTIVIPAGVMVTGALVKVPTLLVVDGDVSVFTGEEVIRICGRHTVECEAYRKGAWLAHQDTTVIMLMATSAKTVREAEQEMTDEFERLKTRREP